MATMRSFIISFRARNNTNDVCFLYSKLFHFRRGRGAKFSRRLFQGSSRNEGSITGKWESGGKPGTRRDVTPVTWPLFVRHVARPLSVAGETHYSSGLRVFPISTLNVRMCVLYNAFESVAKASLFLYFGKCIKNNIFYNEIYIDKF